MHRSLCQWTLFFLLPFALRLTAEEETVLPTAKVNTQFEIPKFSVSANDFKMIRADRWSISGDNLIVRGNVFVPTKNYDIYADQVVINLKNRDFDARGNLRLYQKSTLTQTVQPGELAMYENVAGINYKITGVSTDKFGYQTVTVESRLVTGTVYAEMLSGNLLTGYFQFSNARLQTYDLSAKAKSGRRLANGIIKLQDAEVSNCPYLESDNAHYSFSCKDVEIRPYNTQLTGSDQLQKDYNEYSLTATGCMVRVYGVPILWLPYIYKPKTETLGLFQIQYGNNSNYGNYISVSKKYQLLDYPDSWIRVNGDWLEKRGFGGGVKGGINMENSKTTYSFYNIYDKNPEEDHDDLEGYGISLPHYRYDFRISNVTHITPDLDFRGHFEYMSDEFFNEDFAYGYYSGDPRPVTFAALERQFDHFTASIYFRPQVNRFFTTVEQLPTVQLNSHRQEILNTNIYHQGETSVGYFKRKWRNFEDVDYNEPYDYHSVRFDNVHFLYYPIQLDFLTIVPRVGMRMTAYSNSTKEKMQDEDLYKLMASMDPNYAHPGSYSKDYDNQGGSRFRFVGELGIQANTKISRTWQDIRSYWLNLDGLRHVFIPYINYTYIPEPSESREYLYYFDDIDRIEEQNFIRLGMINRLQTRQGESLTNYFLMENYWDFYLKDQDDYGHVGDFCNKITMTPVRGLNLSTFFVISPSDGKLDDKYRTVYRNGRDVGHPGLNIDCLSRLSFTVSYEPVKDFSFNFSYQYQNPYRSRSSYSMGSSFTQLETGRSFDRFYTDITQQLTFGLKVPITPDHRTFFSYNMEYDFSLGFAPTHRFGLVRQFHCWEVAAEYIYQTENTSDGKESNSNFRITANLVKFNGPLVRPTSGMFSAGEPLR